MKPTEAGWLNEYLEFRKDLLRDLATEPSKTGTHPDQALYRVIQPTGLMYGYSMQAYSIPDFESWSERDRMKVVLAESLISSALLFHDKPLKTAEELSEIVFQTLESIGDFYNNIFPELSTPTKTLFGRKRSPMEVVEKILEKRIDRTKDFEGNFWKYFFHNSLLFLDIFIYGQWIHTNADKVVADFFKYEREELRFSVVKVIAAAAHANKEIVYEERKLFDYFIQSTELSSDRKKEAQRIFEEGIAVEDINLPSENSWILKKFFLELGILTLWADKVVEQSELDFLKAFCLYLGFSEDDLENSLLAIEGFVLEHWDHIIHLQKNADYNVVSEQYVNRVASLAHRNAERIKEEIHANEEVLALIKRASNQELTEEEHEYMRNHVVKILKTIPSLVIISVPQKLLTLPMLMKILPSNLFAENQG
jgi:hypothetical protein